MPYRCEHCLTLSATEEINCECKHKQRVVRVEVVHFMTPDGPGRPMSRKRIINKGPDGKGQVNEVTEDVILKLGCDSTVKSPIASSYLHAVTCLSCLKNSPTSQKPIPIVAEETEETLDDYLSGVD